VSRRSVSIADNAANCFVSFNEVRRVAREPAQSGVGISRHLQKAQAELAHVTRVTTLGELTASITHDINQPLAALAKKAPPKMDWLDLNEAIGEVVAMARSEVQRNRVLLQTRLANDLPLISGDKIQLQQVILKSADKRYGSHEWSG